jgi:WD40 repeat protein
MGIQIFERFHLFDLAGNKEMLTISVEGHGGENDFRFSPDEKYFAIVTKPGILIYSLETFHVIKKITLPEIPWEFEFIPHKDQLVWSCGENYFRIIDFDGKQIREVKMIEKESELEEIDKANEGGDFSNENPRVLALAVSPDAKYIAAAGSFTGGRIRIFTLGGSLAQTIREEHNGAIGNLRFTSDGKYLLSEGGHGRDFTRVYRNF